VRIIGIDFSAARDASRKIWLAFGNAVNDQLHIETLAPLETLAHRPLANASAVLARIIASSGPSIIACDACFGLPVPSSAAPWHTWLLSYPSRFADAEQLRQEGRDAHGRERKRLTDRVARAPFAPTNLRIYRQTDSWLRSVLHPLVAADAVAVAPFERLREDRPCLLEVCPSVSLRELGLPNLRYKGSDHLRRQCRCDILTGLTRLGLDLPSSLASRALDDPGGDALDALIAAITAWLVVREELLACPLPAEAFIEGWIYYPILSSPTNAR
jgi:hypothetical protein